MSNPWARLSRAEQIEFEILRRQYLAQSPFKRCSEYYLMSPADAWYTNLRLLRVWRCRRGDVNAQ